MKDAHFIEKTIASRRAFEGRLLKVDSLDVELPDADENIERVFLSEDQIDGMVREGSVDDAKTLATWLLYKSKVR